MFHVSTPLLLRPCPPYGISVFIVDHDVVYSSGGYAVWVCPGVFCLGAFVFLVVQDPSIPVFFVSLLLLGVLFSICSLVLCWWRGRFFTDSPHSPAPLFLPVRKGRLFFDILLCGVLVFLVAHSHLHTGLLDVFFWICSIVSCFTPVFFFLPSYILCVVHRSQQLRSECPLVGRGG